MAGRGIFKNHIMIRIEHRGTKTYVLWAIPYFLSQAVSCCFFLEELPNTANYQRHFILVPPPLTPQKMYKLGTKTVWQGEKNIWEKFHVLRF